MCVSYGCSMDVPFLCDDGVYDGNIVVRLLWVYSLDTCLLDAIDAIGRFPHWHCAVIKKQILDDRGLVMRHVESKRKRAYETNRDRHKLI